ncbi:unnamed protein product [Photorhabdus laumondii subsp. laumondii TTO1]|uniref:Photorhabdus luminescens subsp. laumondii TTO1 complete genome segment 1/17 n=1 Tax=Photorhabdus laumondii subsp. laumondii (strain DSM 15139 / CIP 105565 / TT01) TaxID=243265 RepID=Q7N9N6_PHOLL|nr:unnamed protein product [Photorhabdus laumondii subsp. laumondii TTO1]
MCYPHSWDIQMGIVPQLLREKFSFIAVIPSRPNDIGLSEIPLFPVIIFCIGYPCRSSLQVICLNDRFCSISLWTPALIHFLLIGGNPSQIPLCTDCPHYFMLLSEPLGIFACHFLLLLLPLDLSAIAG